MTVPVRPDGLIDLAALATMLQQVAAPAMLALQAANNETGVLQPVRAAAELVHAAGGHVVCDAVQAAGRVPFDMIAEGADAVLLSSHKIGGPKGAGAVVLAEGLRLDVSLIRGGGQERGMRSGTENVAAIAGFGAAAVQAADLREMPIVGDLQSRLERGLARMGAAVLGSDAPRLPNTTCFAVPELRAETLLMALDLEGFAVSSGSACSSGKVSRSHVLEAMGIDPHLSHGALRVSFGWASTVSDVDRFVACLDGIVNRMRKRTFRAAA